MRAELFLLEPDTEEFGWQDRALCAQTDPEAFFPEKGGSTREAKKVCLTCEVRDGAGVLVDPNALAFGAPFSVRCQVSFQAQIPFIATASRMLTVVQHEVMERYP